MSRDYEKYTDEMPSPNTPVVFRRFKYCGCTVYIDLSAFSTGCVTENHVSPSVLCKRHTPKYAKGTIGFLHILDYNRRKIEARNRIREVSGALPPEEYKKAMNYYEFMQIVDEQIGEPKKERAEPVIADIIPLRMNELQVGQIRLSCDRTEKARIVDIHQDKGALTEISFDAAPIDGDWKIVQRRVMKRGMFKHDFPVIYDEPCIDFKTNPLFSTTAMHTPIKQFTKADIEEAMRLLENPKGNPALEA